MSTSGMVIKCRALVSWNKNEPFSIEEIEVDPPKDGEARVKMVSTSLCRSDLSAMEGHVVPGLYHGQYPTVMGHEGVGIVESVGPGVTTLKPGDQVIPLFMIECGKCPLCLSGTTNFCAVSPSIEADGYMLDGTVRMSCKGKKLFHFAGCSTFSEYTVLPEIRLAKVGPAPMDILQSLCVMGCCVPTGMGTALNTGKVPPGAVCAVWGLGAVGLAVVMGCKMAGASAIIGIDTNGDKEEIGRSFGCTDFLNPTCIKESVKEYLKKTYKLCDRTFEVIGNPKVMKDAIECTRPGGTCVIIGVSGGKELTFDPVNLLYKKTITGSLFGDYRGRTDVPKLVDDVLNKKLDVSKFITHTIKLDQANEALKDFRAGKGVRIAIVF